MTKDKNQIIKDQESIGNIQITSDEYNKAWLDSGVFAIALNSIEFLYFKPKTEDKRVFENEILKIIDKIENETKQKILGNLLDMNTQCWNAGILEVCIKLKQAIKEAERQGLWK